MRGPVSATGLKVPRAATADPRRAGVLNAEYAHRTTARPPALLSVGHWQAGTVALHRGDVQERKRSTIGSAPWRRAGTSPPACRAMPRWT